MFRFILLASLCCALPLRAAEQVSIKELVEPNGIHSVRLSPDGKRLVVIRYSGLNYDLMIVDADTMKAKIPVYGKHVTDGFWRFEKRPLNAIWVQNDLLAVDYGYTAESMTPEGRTVAVLGERVLGKADYANPDSSMLLTITDLKDGDVALIDARNGKKTKFRVPMGGKPMKWVFDKRGELRAITLVNSEFWNDVSKVSNWYKPSGQGEWQKLAEFSIAEDFWLPFDIVDKSDRLLISTRAGRDTYAIFEYDTATRKIGKMIAGHPTQDILDVGGASEEAARKVVSRGMMPETVWFDEEWDAIQQSVNAALPNRINTLSGDTANRMLVYSYSDMDPGRWYLLETKDMKLTYLLSARESVVPARMQPMETMKYPSGDGLTIPAFLTRPAGVTGPAPTIVMIHGGPAVRDEWGWDKEVQFLASRGYVVFQPQFRGSSGFGRKFEMAGYGQWGKAMQDDVTAGVQELITRKIADPSRICIYGASYGGYAALWGLAKDPDLYKCGISFAGVADIEYMFKDSSDVNSSKIGRELRRSRIGDPRLNNVEFDAVSPLKHAGQIKGPVLLVHGKLDERVPISHARKMKKALEKEHKSIEWLEFEDEAHGIDYIRNQVLFLQMMETFLEKHIGKGAAASPPKAPDTAATPP